MMSRKAYRALLVLQEELEKTRALSKKHQVWLYVGPGRPEVGSIPLGDLRALVKEIV